MNTSIESRISELPKLTKAELMSLWRESFGRAAPPCLRRQLMIRFLAYTIQERAYGGLNPAAVKRLRELGRLLEKEPAAALPGAPVLRAGTRLIRDWRGKRHEVLVEESGYEYQGKRFSSLSEVARHITGTRWSGPLFFGLNQRSLRR